MRFGQAELIRMGFLLFLLVVPYAGNVEILINPKYYPPSLVFTIIATMGLMAIMITGGIDVSLGSVMGLAAAIFAIKFNEGSSIFTALSYGLILPALFSFISGFIAYESKLPPMVVTFALTFVFSVFIKNITVELTDFSTIILHANNIPSHIYIIMFGITFVAMLVIFTIWGEKAYAVRKTKEWGSLQSAYRRFFIYGIYFLAGLLFAGAGILLSIRVMSATAVLGSGYEITVLIAAMLGGASLKGGKGNIINAILAAVIVFKLDSAMDILGFSLNYQSLILSGILIALIIIDIIAIFLEQNAAAKILRA